MYEALESFFKQSETLSVPSLLFQYMSKSLWISYRRNQFNKCVSFTEEEKRMLESYDVEFARRRRSLPCWTAAIITNFCAMTAISWR